MPEIRHTGARPRSREHSPSPESSIVMARPWWKVIFHEALRFPIFEFVYAMYQAIRKCVDVAFTIFSVFWAIYLISLIFVIATGSPMAQARC